ncbi:hypothetical protein BGZ65_002592 [Modicella reniformis]|uniref:Uncharacterized protein n=1 Tax=Modicella reniformis TaxID=1440133 RepID=A0A9P6M0C6_9FUNG|nr:hypothetical protein BGZ65_002592 [Modicella reniformis]
MTLPEEPTAASKHLSSPDAHDEPATKRRKQYKTKDNAATKQKMKEKDANTSEQPEESPSKSTTATNDSSTRNGRSSKAKTEKKVKGEKEEEEAEEAEEESNDDQVKTESSESEKVGSSQKTDEEQRVIEKGHAFFFYRPKMDIEKPSGAGDVQKLYMLLSPDGAAGRPATEDEVGQLDSSPKPTHDGKPCHRLLIIPQKSLPSPGKGPKSRIWSFVDEASSDLDKVETKLERYTYSTKSRGERTQESARLIASARYDILIHHGHSHFVYELEVPQQPGEVQQEFNISKEGQFVIQVKNPEIQTPATARGQARYVSLGENAAKLPKHLQEKFRGIRKDWVRHTTLDSTEFLDIPHVEIGLFAVNKDAKEEFAEVMKALEAEVKEEEDNEIDQEEKPEDYVYKKLDLDEDMIPDAVEEFK